MAQGIPEEIIDEIRQHTDLVTLVGEYIKLERRGKNMVGLCPFHSEKTPSFTVSPDKQLYHCFGCGASGNVFSLIMQMEKMTFPEAARFLARRAGVRIPEPEKRTSGEENYKEKIYRLNLMATSFYAYCLTKSNTGKKALDYLRKRGINGSTIETFMLGYAPADWTGFFNFARKKGFAPEMMVKAGLVSPGKEKGYYDRFRDRLIFPIANISGKIAGFGGRTLSEGDKSGPKYLNSPETPVFEKGLMLYGLNLAKEEIRRLKSAVVMEGYTDMITAYQAGIKNVVASLGTALTAEQGRLLRHQAETVITAYDSDAAGEAATWRGLAILQRTGCLVRVAEMPAGSDPDSYIREKGADSFKTLLDRARPLMEYRLAVLKKRYDLVSEKGRIDYTEELMTFLNAAVNQVEQDHYLKKAAEVLNVEEEALRQELKRRRRTGARRREQPEGGIKTFPGRDKIDRAEKILLSLMIQSKEIAERGRNLLEPEYIKDERIREIVEAIWHYSAGEVTCSAEKLLNRFSDPQTTKLITEAATDPSMQDLSSRTAKRMAEDCFWKLKQSWENKKRTELVNKLKELEASGTEEEITEFLRKNRNILQYQDSGSYRNGKGGDFND